MQEYIKILQSHYDMGEARAIFYRLMEDKYGLSRVDVCLGEIDRMPEEKKIALLHDINLLSEGVPVQHITGFQYFHGLRFDVDGGVLIPRTETEELVDWIIHDSHNQQHTPAPSRQAKVLDIGCGSGAIAVSLAKVGMDVTAWDISDDALNITARNAKANDAEVNIVRQNALNPPMEQRQLWDIIVSNPPYICNKEKVGMDDNVLNHEPHLALFVPDDDPLLFYRAIARYAVQSLLPDGALYYEINEHYGQETVEMLYKTGFKHVTLRQDQFGKDRMIKAYK